MAENELLDIKGRRWRQTRRYLADTQADASTIASCAAEECEAGLRKDLNKYFREGTHLLLILKAAREDPAAMRRAIEAFKNKQIARIIQHAIQQCGPPYEASRVAQYAADRLLDVVFDKVAGYAGTLPEYGEQARRKELDAALSQSLQDLRATVSTLLEHSLTGTRLKPPQPKPRTQREPIAVRTAAVLGTSLLGSRSGRHGPAKSH
jgi:hypothetical protein